MADVRISALPTAQSPISGNELVPIVQNGLTVQTTVSAITQSPSLTQTFLTVGQQPQLPNSRYIATGTGLGFTDGGAQNPYTLALNGTAGSLEGASTGVVVKTAPNTIAARTLSTSGNGISVANGDGVSGNPTFQLTGIAQALANATGSGLLALGSSTTVSPVTIVGVANQISVLNGDGSGNPTIGLSDNPIVPGNAGLVIPTGTTAQRGLGSDGEFRYNTDSAVYEGYASGAWREFSLTGGVVTFSAGTTGFAPSSPTSGAVVLSGVLNSTSGGTGASALTGYLYGNGASPATASATIPTTALSGTITNAQLANSALTVNGTLISLGGSGTITAATPNALTIGTGLSGTTYNGANPVTIAISNTTVVANSYGSATAVPTFTVNAQGQLTAASNTAIAIPSSAITDKGLANGVATLDGSGKVPISELPSAVLGTLSYQGTWNASTNTPTLASGVGVKGYYYVVSVAGSTNLDGITDWKVGDWAVYNGTAWQKVDNTDAVTSVNGYTGAVVLSYTDVGAPSTGGINATGTWGIGISGNAATATSATTSTNIAGGAAGSLPYQSAAGTTAMIAAGTNGYILQMNAGIPSWQADAARVSSISFASTGLTPATATSGAVTVGGTLVVANGGTGLSSVTANQILYGNGTGALNTSASLTFDGTTLSTTTVDATNLEVTNLKAKDGTAAGSIADATGVVTLTTLASTTGNITTVNSTTVDTTNIEVTNLKAKDGTAAGSIADATGVVTLASSVLTTTDINGGTIDGTSVGASVASSGAFTDFSASGTASFTSTGAVKLPVGTVAQRPTPAAGMLRFNDDSDEFEGYNGTAWSSVGGSAISNDTSTATNVYPLFANATSGTASSVFTSNAKLLYKPSTGEFQSTVLNASNGIVVNNASIATSYSIPSGSNAMSAGPVAVSSGITVTVPSGSVWTIV
jgi:hypothetical protein